MTIVCPPPPPPPPPPHYGAAVESARLRLSAAERWVGSSAALLESARLEFEDARDYLRRLEQNQDHSHVRPMKNNTVNDGDDEMDIGDIGNIVVTMTGETDHETLSSHASSLGMGTVGKNLSRAVTHSNDNVGREEAAVGDVGEDARIGNERQKTEKISNVVSPKTLPKLNNVNREIRQSITAACENIIQIGQGSRSAGSSAASYQREATNEEGGGEFDAKREDRRANIKIPEILNNARRGTLTMTAARRAIKEIGKGSSVSSGSTISAKNEAKGHAEIIKRQRTPEKPNAREAIIKIGKGNYHQEEKTLSQKESDATLIKETDAVLLTASSQEESKKEEDDVQSSRQESNEAIPAANEDCCTAGPITAIEVTECGIPEVNGRYHRFEISDGVPSYSKIASYDGKEAMFTISRQSSNAGTKKWHITATIPHRERELAFYVAYAPGFAKDPPGKNWMAVEEGGEDFPSGEYEGRGVRPAPVIRHERASNGGNVLGVKVDGRRSRTRRSSIRKSRQAVRETANRVRRRSVSTQRSEQVRTRSASTPRSLKAGPT